MKYHIAVCVCLPQLTVQESSWTVSFASSTIWCSCYPTPAPITAAPTTNKSSQQWSQHPAVTMNSGLTWTVVCSLPVMMQMTAWSWLWRFLNYATTNRKSIVITITMDWLDDQKSDCPVWSRFKLLNTHQCKENSKCNIKCFWSKQQDADPSV